jgi:hypothetical protein
LGLQPEELMETVGLLLFPETSKSELGVKAEEPEGEMAFWGRVWEDIQAGFREKRTAEED